MSNIQFEDESGKKLDQGSFVKEVQHTSLVVTQDVYRNVHHTGALESVSRTLVYREGQVVTPSQIGLEVNSQVVDESRLQAAQERARYRPQDTRDEEDAAPTEPTTHTITSIEPSSGPAEGGNKVTIVGTGFTGSERATIGGASIIDFEVESDSAITGRAPKNEKPDVVNVTVRRDGKTITATDIYTYE